VKKLFLASVILALFANLAFSQSVSTIEDVFKVLDANIKKYPYAHLVAINKYDDDRSPRNPIKQFQRFQYDSESTDVDGNPLRGEVVYITMIKNGYRYELKVDFLPAKERNSKDIKTVRGQILRIVRDLPESEILTNGSDSAS
jgi:hypothetical protein